MRSVLSTWKLYMSVALWLVDCSLTGVVRGSSEAKPKGPCGGAVCITLYAPVCGTNRVTYGNSCNAMSCNVTVACEQECPCPRSGAGSGLRQKDPAGDKENDSSQCSKRVDRWNSTCASSAEEGLASMSVFGAQTNSLTSFASVASTGVGFGMAARAAPMPTTIGLTTGGAQDVGNFRENINNSYLPLPSDITYGGIIKDYYFEMASNTSQPCSTVFCPSYSLAVAADPLVSSSKGEQQEDVFVAVGLDSGIAATDFDRPLLQLVVVLDVSASMGAPFDRYYYDSGARQGESDAAPKIAVARDALNALVDELRPDDTFGVVLFDSSACTVQPLVRWGCVDKNKFKEHGKEEISERGSTNMAAGMDLATLMLQDCDDCAAANRSEVERRIIFMTDAQINTGDITSGGMLERVKQNADKGIYTTVIGIGVDFNTELTDTITKTRGANYYSVHSPDEFKKTLGDEFNYMVTPLVFDLRLKVDPSSLKGANGWKILAAYGSPNENGGVAEGGDLLRVDTLFPAPKTEEGVRGGVILLRMKAGNPQLQLVVEYEDRSGRRHSTSSSVDVSQMKEALDEKEEYYQSVGVYKAVVLARYTDLLQGWLLDEWQANNNTERPPPVPRDYCNTLPLLCPLAESQYTLSTVGEGCIVREWLSPVRCILPPPPPLLNATLSPWERQSQPLHASSITKKAFEKFQKYLEGAINGLDDAMLSQEKGMLNEVINSK